MNVKSETACILASRSYASKETIRDEFQANEYRVQIISDCVASPDKRHHDVTLAYLERISKVVKLDKFKEEFNAGLAAENAA
jgi:hypothetical protein